MLRNPNIDTTIPSMTDMDQLDANLKAMSQPFGPDDDKILADAPGAHLAVLLPFVRRVRGTVPPGSAGAGCAALRALMPMAMASSRWGASGIWRFSLHVQAKCGDCTECTVNCPHGVKVAREMARAQELFAC